MSGGTDSVGMCCTHTTPVWEKVQHLQSGVGLVCLLMFWDNIATQCVVDSTVAWLLLVPFNNLTTAMGLSVAYNHVAYSSTTLYHPAKLLYVPRCVHTNILLKFYRCISDRTLTVQLSVSYVAAPHCTVGSCRKPQNTSLLHAVR